LDAATRSGGHALAVVAQGDRRDEKRDRFPGPRRRARIGAGRIGGALSRGFWMDGRSAELVVGGVVGDLGIWGRGRK
jgi:hypothetical protein